MKVLIITPGGMPVPAVEGGAVQTLIDELIDVNQSQEAIDFTIIGPYNLKAKMIAENKYFNNKFIWFKSPKIINILDKLIYKFFSIFSSHPQSYSRILKSFYYIKQLKKVLKKENYDKIIFEHNNILLLTLKNKTIFKKYKEKYLIHIHNQVRTIKPIYKYFSQCKYIVTISNYMKTYLVSDPRLNIKAENVYVLYNCIDIEMFNSKVSADYTLIKDIDLNKKKILFAGRINKEKGIEETLEIYSNLDHNMYQLIIVGDFFYSEKGKNKYCTNLISKYKNLIDNKNIIFTGYIEYEKMPSIYKCADICILPSMWDEPAGLAMLEACSCNVKVITTNSGGIPEYVGKSAIILERNNVIQEGINAIKEIGKFNPNYDNLMDFNKDNYYYNFLKILTMRNN